MKIIIYPFIGFAITSLIIVQLTVDKNEKDLSDIKNLLELQQHKIEREYKNISDENARLKNLFLKIDSCIIKRDDLNSCFYDNVQEVFE